MAVSLDGVMVPMKAGQRKDETGRAAATGKPTRGPAGLICEAAVRHRDGLRSPAAQPLHTVRMGECRNPKKATIKGMLCVDLRPFSRAAQKLEHRHCCRSRTLDNWRYFDRERGGSPDR